MKYAALVLVLALGSAGAQTKCHGFKMNFCFDGEVSHHVPCPPCPKPVKKKAKRLPSYDCGNGWAVSEPGMCPELHASVNGGTTTVPVEPHGKCWTGAIDEANEVPCPVEPQKEGWITLKSVPMLPGETGLCMDAKCYPLPQEKPPVGWPPEGAGLIHVESQEGRISEEMWRAGNEALECLKSNSVCEYIHIMGTPMATEVSGTDGSKMVKLSDSEYSNLQKLRQSVVDEEKRLAVKYGAQLKPACPECPIVTIYPPPPPYRPDHYEFHGQFLLIERGK